MAQELCHCGLRLIETEDARYEIDGEACCSWQCYNDALAAPGPLDRDGFMWGGTHEDPARGLH
jgi:hypothetical protein